MGHRYPACPDQSSSLHHQRSHLDFSRILRKRLPVRRLALPLRPRPKRPSSTYLPQVHKTRPSVDLRPRHLGILSPDLPLRRRWRFSRSLQLVPQHHNHRKPLHLGRHLHRRDPVAESL